MSNKIGDKEIRETRDMVNYHRLAALAKIRAAVRKKYLDYKSTDDALNNPLLLDEWMKMPDDIVQEIITKAKKGDRRGTRLAIKKFYEDYYAEEPMEVLRLRARAKHIVNYSRMGRQELIHAINSHEAAVTK